MRLSLRLALVVLTGALVAESLHAQPVTLEFVQARFDGEESAGLDGTEDIALSPDGRFVYASSYNEDALNVFARDPATDSLTFTQALRDEEDGVMGLFGPRGLAVSADGAFVYVAAEGFATVFARDASTGRLSFVQTVEDEVDGALVDDATEIALSPDGDHVYVASDFSETLTIFARDAATGRLSVVEALENAEGGAEGLDAPSALLVSPDGAHLYAANGDDSYVSIFTRAPGTGALSYVGQVEDGAGGVDGIDGAEGLAMSDDGRFLYVTGRHDNALAVFMRDAASGALSPVAVYRDGDSGVGGLAEANGVALSPDGDYVYAVGGSCCVATEPGTLAVFSRDASAGTLTFVEALEDRVSGVSGLFGAGGVAVSPDGGGVYVAAYFADAVTAFHRDASAGTLTPAGFVLDGTGGSALRGARESAVSPDGRHVYTTGESDSALNIFRRDAASGALSLVGTFARSDLDLFSSPTAVATSPDGAQVYVTIRDALLVFGREATTGALSLAEVQQDGQGGVDGLNGAQRIALSPDGAHVYVSGNFDNALAVFSRDVATGALTFVEAVRDGQSGVDGLNSASGVEVSPDGQHVYATGRFDDAVAVFARDPSTGVLTFVEVQRNGAGGVEGLGRAESVRVSPDGAHVYATSPLDDAVAVFSRDAATGALTFVEVLREGENGVTGLDGALDLAVSPDGTTVFVTGGNAVAVFSRDAATGALTPSDVAEDGENGVDGIGGARHVAISPDGRHTYVTGSRDDAVAVFVTSRPVPSEGGPAERLPVALSAPHPNPAAGWASVRVTVAAPLALTVDLFDALGRRVARLHEGDAVAGDHEIQFDTRGLPTGVYTLRASSEGGAHARRLVVVR